MKYTLAILLFSTAFASAQDFVAPAQKAPTQRTIQVTPQIRVTGPAARAMRAGNPAQLINPFAPREYGDASGSVVYESSDPIVRVHGRERAQGVILIALNF